MLNDLANAVSEQDYTRAERAHATIQSLTSEQLTALELRAMQRELRVVRAQLQKQHAALGGELAALGSKSKRASAYLSTDQER